MFEKKYKRERSTLIYASFSFTIIPKQMKQVYTDFKELNKDCKENNISHNQIFFKTCKICEIPFATLDNSIIVCSDNCSYKLSELNRNIELYTIKAKQENWYINKDGGKIKIQNDYAKVVVTDFSIENLAKGMTDFNYVIQFNNQYFRLKGVKPLKIEYDNIRLLINH